MTEYLVPAAYGEAEFIEKRSRFIGRVWPVDSETEAMAHIKEMREKHWDATHNVYAYIIKEGGAMRYSDDGEPSGTSGMPVLGVFRAKEVFNVCCVVTRYFGGVLLGAGGLVRAYSHTAALALEQAGIAAMRLWRSLCIPVPYNFYARVKGLCLAQGAVLEREDFGAAVTLELLLPDAAFPEFCKKLQDLSAGGIQPQDRGCRFTDLRIDA